MSENNKTQNEGILWVLIVIMLLSLFNYFYFLNEQYVIYNLSKNKYIGIIKSLISIPDIVFRVGIWLLIISYIFMSPNQKANMDREVNRQFDHTISIISSILFIVGYTFNKHYALVMFPIVSVVMIIFLSRSINDYFKVENEEKNKDLNCGPETDMSFDLHSEEGVLRVGSPQQGISVSGGAGAGKSASIIEPAMVQMINKGYCGVIYDFKGNPPTLGTTAYNALLNRPKSYILNGKEILNKNVSFGIINWVNLNQSVQCNPIAPKYIQDTLKIKEIATLILFSINREWVSKKDFWADNAISILVATIKMFRNNYPELCTLPHVISAIISDGTTLLNWLASDEEVAKEAQSSITAFRQKAAGQLAGSISSVQLPMAILSDEKIYWILSKDEFDLDISNPNEPKILCIANSPDLKKALAPGIALIIKTCMNNMNMKGKNKSFLLMDEFPQIYIPEIYDFPATARSNKCVTMLGYQGYPQLEMGYGKDQAKSIVTNLGNNFQGMCNDNESADAIVKMFGEDKYTDTSFTQNQSNLSQSFSTKKEKQFQNRDVMGQASGHFMGKVANGKPPLFSAQFEYLDTDSESGNTYMIQKGKKRFLWKTHSIPDFTNVTKEDIRNNYIRINEEVKAILEPFIISENTENE